MAACGPTVNITTIESQSDATAEPTALSREHHKPVEESSAKQKHSTKKMCYGRTEEITTVAASEVLCSKTGPNLFSASLCDLWRVGSTCGVNSCA